MDAVGRHVHPQRLNDGSTGQPGGTNPPWLVGDECMNNAGPPSGSRPAGLVFPHDATNQTPCGGAPPLVSGRLRGLGASSLHVCSLEYLNLRLPGLLGGSVSGWSALSRERGVVVVVVMFLRAAANKNALASRAWDPHPYILQNLFLPMLAGLQGAILLIAAKRQDAIASATAQHD